MNRGEGLDALLRGCGPMVPASDTTAMQLNYAF